MINSGRSNFQRTFQLSPIFFVNGVAGAGNAVPVSVYLQNGYTPPSLDQYFANFKPMPGGVIESWGIAEYPLAALTVAANAVVQNPLSISMLMVCPVQNNPQNSYAKKLATLSALKATIDNHILGGGWFDVLTPAYYYSGCLLTSLKDVTNSDTKQVQLQYQWDFTKPLITEEQAGAVQSTFLNKVSMGLQTSGQSWGPSG
jgi:hypothetical protein